MPRESAAAPDRRRRRTVVQRQRILSHRLQKIGILPGEAGIGVRSILRLRINSAVGTGRIRARIRETDGFLTGLTFDPPSRSGAFARR